MKNVIISLFIISCLVAGLSASSFGFDLVKEANAKIKSYQEKITKVESSIKALDEKLKKAKDKDKASITKSINEQRKMIADMNKIINKEKVIIAENTPVVAGTAKPAVPAVTAVPMNTDAEIAKIKAKIAFYQGKITKIKSDSKKMQASLKSAKSADKAKISKVIAAQDKRVVVINKTIAALQASLAKLESHAIPTNVTVVPSMQYPVEKQTLAKSGLAFEGGMQGGAAAINVDYFFPANKNLSTKLNAGYGIGNNYSLVVLGGGVQFYLKPDNYVGASLDLASYSSSLGAVQGILGLGTIDSGSKFGFGLFAGKKITKNLDAQIAYSTALGITVTGIYQFK